MLTARRTAESVSVEVRNAGSALALNVKLTLLGRGGRARAAGLIIPTTTSRSLPGERRTVEIGYGPRQGSAPAAVALRGLERDARAGEDQGRSPMTGSVHATETLVFAILVQLVLMIGAARLMNTLFRRLGQPGVIGEIVAGLALGPSLFGHLFPELSLAIFGAKASTPITVLSQVGLILLMFQIGGRLRVSAI